MKHLIFILFFFVCISTVSYAGYGTAGAQILNLNASARSGAMGYAMGGVAGDVNAVVYNPAGLYSLKDSNFQFSRLTYFLDSGMTSLSFGRQTDVIGVGVKLKVFSAEDKKVDVSGRELGSFDIRFTQATIGAGVSVSDKVALGSSIKIINEKYDLYPPLNASSIAFDIGLLLEVKEKSSFGVVLKNIGPAIEVSGKKAFLDRKLALAGAHDTALCLYVWEIFHSRQQTAGFQLGAEFDILSHLNLRAGGIYITRPDFMAGFGIYWEGIGFDYAFLPHMDMGLVHRVTLGAVF